MASFLDGILNRIKKTGSNILNAGGDILNRALDIPLRGPQQTQAQSLPQATTAPSPSPAGDSFKVLNKTFSIQGPTAIPAATSAPTTAAIQQRARAQAAQAPATGGLGRNPDIAKYNIEQRVKQAIDSAAQEFGLPASLLYDIAQSEGGFRPDARNETPEGREVGVPVGLFQFTPGTWDQDLRNYASQPNSSLKNWNSPPREDPIANARAAAYLIKNGQLGRWTASEPNWGRFYSDEELAPYFTQTPGYKGRGR